MTNRRDIRPWHFLLALLALALLAACTSSPLDEPPPPGWEMLAGGPGTGCAFDTPFAFFSRQIENPDGVALYFQAGGACWSAASCIQDSVLPVFDQTVTPAEFRSYGGIFDFENPENPLRNYDMVFIPLCTGDVHIGAARVRYQDVGNLLDMTVHHNGAANTLSVLNWFYANYPDADNILVMGSSAGALGSLYYSPEIFTRYPDSDVKQFGDGYIGVAPYAWSALDVWSVRANVPPSVSELAELATEDLTKLNIMRGISAAFPERRFGIFSHANDLFQLAYYGAAGGNMPDWLRERDAILAGYDSLPNVHYYLGAGFLHTILAFDEFYTMTANDVRFRDWFAAFVTGQPIDNQRCETGTLGCP